MEKKRSRGVTIFAWLSIIVNIFTLLTSLNFNTYFEMYKSFDKSIVMGIILISLFSIIVGIVAGFGILKLKEMMRKIVVVINSFDVLFGILLLLLSIDSFKQYAYSLAVAQVGTKGNVLGIDTLTNIGFYTMIFVSLFYIAISLLFIFFFTRPKVKEQFK